MIRVLFVAALVAALAVGTGCSRHDAERAGAKPEAQATPKNPPLSNTEAETRTSPPEQDEDPPGQAGGISTIPGEVRESELGVHFYPGSTDSEGTGTLLSNGAVVGCISSRTSPERVEKIVEFYSMELGENAKVSQAANGSIMFELANLRGQWTIALDREDRLCRITIVFLKK